MVGLEEFLSRTTAEMHSIADVLGTQGGTLEEREAVDGRIYRAFLRWREYE